MVESCACGESVIRTKSLGSEMTKEEKIRTSAAGNKRAITRSPHALRQQILVFLPWIYLRSTNSVGRVPYLEDLLTKDPKGLLAGTCSR